MTLLLPSIALVLYSLVLAILARAVYSKLRSKFEFRDWLASYVGQRAANLLAPVVIAVEAACLLLVLLAQGTSLILGILIASATLLLVHKRMDRDASQPCPCLGELSVVWPKLTRIALSGVLVLALLVFVNAALRPGHAPTTDPLWVCAGAAILLLAAEGASLQLKTIQGHLNAESHALVRRSIEDRLGHALSAKRRVLIFFGTLKCSACTKVAEEFASLAKSSPRGGDVFLIDVGISPNQSFRIGGARLIGLRRAVWADLSVSATPALAVVIGSQFITYSGAEDCLRTINRLREQ